MSSSPSIVRLLCAFCDTTVSHSSVTEVTPWGMQTGTPYKHLRYGHTELLVTENHSYLFSAPFLIVCNIAVNSTPPWALGLSLHKELLIYKAYNDYFKISSLNLQFSVSKFSIVQIIIYFLGFIRADLRLGGVLSNLMNWRNQMIFKILSNPNYSFSLALWL